MEIQEDYFSNSGRNNSQEPFGKAKDAGKAEEIEEEKTGKPGEDQPKSEGMDRHFMLLDSTIPEEADELF